MQLIDLGTFTSLSSSNATVINTWTQVAGVSGNDGVLFHGGLYAPTLIGAGVVPQDMNSLLPPGGFGQIVGYLIVGPDPSTDIHAFVWDSLGGTKDIHSSLFGGASAMGMSNAYGVNNLGQVVGSKAPPGQPQSAYLWNLGNVVELQPHIQTPGDNAESVAYDINDAGEIVGTVYWTVPAISKGDSQVFRYIANGDTWLMDPYLGDGAPTSINNDGAVVGNFWSGIVTQNPKAFLWTASGDVSSIPPLGIGEFNDAKDINDQGTAVGWSDTVVRSNPADDASGQRRAFIWDEAHGSRDLNSLVTPLNPEWVLTEANAVNAFGSIVGQGLFNGQMHAYELRGEGQPNLGSQVIGQLAAIIAEITDNSRRRPVRSTHLLPHIHPWGPGDPPPYLLTAVLSQMALGVGGARQQEAVTSRLMAIVQEILGRGPH
jgi:uncharacterized membrane protein